MKIDGQLVVDEFEVYGLRQQSADGIPREIWYEEFDDAIIEQAAYGGLLISRTCWMGEAKVVECEGSLS